MKKIDNPTVKAPFDPENYSAFGDLPIRNDPDTANQYCKERGYTLVKTTADGPFFSSDNARLCNYYDTKRKVWTNSYGFDSVVVTLFYK